MKNWVPINRKEFGSWMTKNFQFKKDDKLFAHQKIVTEFLRNSPYRGLLLFHGLGVGKTRSAISICESIGNDVIVLLPASIKENFENEIYTFTKIKSSQDKYEYIHYNGLTRKLIGELSQDKFDNKTIVIDEVHNFISMVKNGSQNASRLYQMILTSKKSKIVLLSGTPVLNSPDELLYIFNLIKGYFKKYVVVDKKNPQASLEAIASNKSVAYANLLDDQKTIEIYLHPQGYARADDDHHIIQTSNVVFPANMKLAQREYLFPHKPKDFRKLFVEDLQMKNANMFSRRIQGLVSYYEQNNSVEYPQQDKLKVVNCVMTDEQFNTYSDMRAVEMELERKKNNNKDNDGGDDFNDDSVSLYKCYTRACCNFVFPKAIKRQYGSMKKMITKELDDDIEDYVDLDEEDGDKYSAVTIKTALSKLNKETYLKNELEMYSPKMHTIMQKLIKTKGPALVYSSFRNVEGVAIFSMVLEHYGYEELSIKSINGKRTLVNAESSRPKFIVFSSNRENNIILMNIFNNSISNLPADIKGQLPEDFTNLRGEFIKVIIITKSGSEGISLKNVRQVHIMEPYWNDIRIKQVIGRAVRAGSHSDLPLEERHVKPYIYLMSFTDKQKVNKTIALDKGLTTDEIIYSIATQKAKVNNAFLDVLKNTSIDCSLHDGKCKPIGANKDGIVYPLGSVDRDLDDSKIKTSVKATTKQYRQYKVTQNGKVYGVTKEGEKLYFSESSPEKLYYKKNLGKNTKPDAMTSDFQQ